MKKEAKSRRGTDSHKPFDNAVDPAWQGRGIGTRLVASVVEALEKAGVDIMQVSTYEHDVPARRVYEKVGFTEIARTVHYTRPGKRQELNEAQK